jgi:hypothetical protein
MGEGQHRGRHERGRIRGTSLISGSLEELVHGRTPAIISAGHQMGAGPVHGLHRVPQPRGHGHDIGPPAQPYRRARNGAAHASPGHPGQGTATLLVPAGAAAGSYPVTLTATNSISAATQAFTLTVGTAPAITSAAGYWFIPGGADYFNGTATGSPAPSLTETAAPAGVTFTDYGNGNFSLSVPVSITELSYRTYWLTITAANGVGPPAVQYSLAVLFRR